VIEALENGEQALAAADRRDLVGRVSER
jgi:hypothetical protein